MTVGMFLQLYIAQSWAHILDKMIEMFPYRLFCMIIDKQGFCFVYFSLPTFG